MIVPFTMESSGGPGGLAEDFKSFAVKSAKRRFDCKFCSAQSLTIVDFLSKVSVEVHRNNVVIRTGGKSNLPASGTAARQRSIFSWASFTDQKQTALTMDDFM